MNTMELDGTLDVQMANVNSCKFNRWGTLVAVGATDGRILIIDFLTRGVVKMLNHHNLPITSLSWSRDGRQLITGCAGQQVVVWDVFSGQPEIKLKYSALILSAQFNPRDDSQFIVHSNGFHPSLETTTPRSTRIVATQNQLMDDAVSCVAYDRRGKYILTGTTKGRIIIYDAYSLQLISIVKQSVQQIRNIVIPRRGSFVLTNSQDRVIRRYDLDELLKAKTSGIQVEPIQKLSDIVNKHAWKSVCCSYDGEYICGATTKAHSLYIWERGTGSLIKILTGGKGESLIDVQWHPTRAVILSVASGSISVWTQAHVENWSAFAPEFTELEENERYVEKEGEFDVEDEDAEQEEKEENMDNDDIDIDVVNVRKDEGQWSSDEEGEALPILPTASNGPLWFIPVTPEIEAPELVPPPAPYADVNFLRQPAGGAQLHYDDPTDLRHRVATSALASSSSKPMVKASRRPTK